MGDCPSPSSRSWWMEGECQSLMCLMAWRDIDIDIFVIFTWEIKFSNVYLDQSLSFEKHVTRPVNKVSCQLSLLST